MHTAEVEEEEEELHQVHLLYHKEEQAEAEMDLITLYQVEIQVEIQDLQEL